MVQSKQIDQLITGEKDFKRKEFSLTWITEDQARSVKTRYLNIFSGNFRRYKVQSKSTKRQS